MREIAQISPSSSQILHRRTSVHQGGVKSVDPCNFGRLVLYIKESYSHIFQELPHLDFCEPLAPERNPVPVDTTCLEDAWREYRRIRRERVYSLI